MPPASASGPRQLNHIASEHSHTAEPPPGAPNAVVLCGIRRSAALSASIVNATNAADRDADSDSVPLSDGSAMPRTGSVAPQRPFHTGARFSANAVAPSRASSESKIGPEIAS